MPDPRDLCTLANVREALEVPTADTSRDALVGTLITAASVAIMQDTGREFAPSTSSATRRIQVDGYMVSLEPYDLRTVSTMTLHPESSSPITLGTADYQLVPAVSADGVYQAVAISRYQVLLSDTAFKFGYALLDIAGAWGFTSVPLDVTRACVETVKTWLRADVGEFGLADMVEAGPTLNPRSAFPIPFKAWAFLAPYRRLSSMAF
jgi:hypothetical protein